MKCNKWYSLIWPLAGWMIPFGRYPEGIFISFIYKLFIRPAILPRQLRCSSRRWNRETLTLLVVAVAQFSHRNCKTLFARFRCSDSRFSADRSIWMLCSAFQPSSPAETYTITNTHTHRRFFTKCTHAITTRWFFFSDCSRALNQLFSTAFFLCSTEHRAPTVIHFVDRSTLGNFILISESSPLFSLVRWLVWELAFGRYSINHQAHISFQPPNSNVWEGSHFPATVQSAECLLISLLYFHLRAYASRCFLTRQT